MANVRRHPGSFGIRRPSRAVSLRDVRQQPVQRMGFDFDEFDRLISEGTSEAEQHPWDLVADPETGELVERAEVGRRTRPAVVEVERGWRNHPRYAGMTDEEYEREIDREVEAEIADINREREEAEWYTGEREWGEDRSVGLSARDRALVQSPLDMAGEGKRPWELTEAEKRANRQREINRRGMEQIRRDQEERERRRTGPDQQTLDLGDPQSQMSQQYLADMFARQAAQPQQGYFGGLGQAVGGMSTEQKVALLVGLGLLTGGTSTPLMAPALGVGAGLAFTQ